VSNAQETPALEFLELRELGEVGILWSFWIFLWVSGKRKIKTLPTFTPYTEKCLLL